MKGQFGETVAKYRRKRELTVRKLAELINMSPSQVSEIETGRRLPPKDKDLLAKLASILRIDFDHLIFFKMAEEDRIKKDSFLFRKLDPDLAWGFCRVADNVDKASLEEAVRKMISDLQSKNKED